nr:SusC/RagA family TonB-linked outer membrane protein [Odoribacter splanchnicus]
MKLFTIFMLVFVLGTTAAGFSQNQLVTLDLHQCNVKQLFKEIRKQTGLRFVFNEAHVEGLAGLNIKAEAQEVKKVLDKVFGSTSLECRFEDDVIFVVERSQPQQAKQEIVVQGQVTDKTGAPLPGVTVRIKGTQLGCVTDVDGYFKMALPGATEPIMVFSFIGMKTEEIKYTGQKELKVVLAEEVAKMDEVVVTGIFKRRKEGFTGSATQVSGEDIRKMTSGNVLKALEMLDPGFKMNTSNLAGSNPNAVPDFQMRGQASIGNYESEDFVVMRGDYNTRPNQPLFVLDGIIGVSATAIMDLDPDRVESITLLKDAAATVIYGSEAANGVVVVETKAPKAGKLQFSYNGNYKLEWADLSVYNLLNAREKLQIEELAGYYDNKDQLGLQHLYNRLQKEVLRGVDTDWLSKPVHTVFAHRHGLNIEGGDRALRYKIYLGANFAPGVMKETDLDTKSGRVDILYRFNKFLISNQLSLDYSKGARTSPYGSFQEYALLNPYYRPYDEQGNIQKVLDDHKTGDDRYPYVGGYSDPVMNPLYNTLFETKDESREFEVREALQVEYMPFDNLRLSLDFTLSRKDGTVETFKSAQHTSFDQIADPELRGSYNWTKTEGYDYRFSLSGAYNKAFGDHLLSAFARYNISESSSDMASLQMTGFANDKLSEIYLGSHYDDIQGNENVSRALGFLFTLNYSYKQRYALDYSMRIDASSQFGRNNRYAPFWSAGLRWNLDKEKFVQKWGIFDELILRGTYGITGSQNFSSYQALQMYTYDGLVKTYRSSDVMGAGLYGIGNPDLKWQQTRNYNASLDFSVWKNLLSAKFEYYEKYTKNTLLDYSLAPSVGFSSIKENLGEISNKGFEVTLRLTPYSDASKQAYWNIILTGAQNKSRIEKISNALKVRNEQQMAEADKSSSLINGADREKMRPLPRYENGYSQTVIWAVRSLGIDPMSGQELFMTRDGQLTNEYNAIDQMPVGDTEPKFAGTVSTSFNYKGLTISLAGRYSWGGQIFNSTLLDKVENANLFLNVDKRALTERWKKPGDKVFFKAIDPNIYKEDTKASSRFVMDNNEFYFSTINVSYRWEAAKSRFLKQIGISSATVGFYMEDICRFSTVKMERGIDYPFSRQTSLSLNVMF